MARVCVCVRVCVCSSYPNQRARKDEKGIERGVAGTLELLNEINIHHLNHSINTTYISVNHQAVYINGMYI